MKQDLLIPRNHKKSTASLKLRALCACSLPSVDGMSEKDVASIVAEQDARLSRFARDKQHTLFTRQEGRNVTIV